MQRSSRKASARLLVLLVVTISIGCAFGRPSADGAIPSSTLGTADERAIRQIIENETRTWNTGDGVGYSRDFAEDGIFTNIRGESFAGYDAFLKQHEFIFRGMFRNTTLQQDVLVLKFVAPHIALVETLTAVTGLSQMPPGAVPDAKGRLRTRLLQVIVRRGNEWKIVAYHNVDVKLGVPVTEPMRD